jgi:uncharacterized coiled-coil protein SlyX
MSDTETETEPAREAQAHAQTPTVETLAAQVAQLQERVATLEEETEQKDARIDDLEATVADQEERIADLEARGKAATRKRNHLAEELERVEAAASAPTDADAEEAGGEVSADTDAPQTPLEQVVGLPEHLADEELTANQERARFIAQDVRDYAERVPAGYAIPSTDLRKVLKAKDGATPHTQTVARVMDFLEELGGEDVTLVKRRGTKRIAFSEDAVERLTEYADRAQARTDADPSTESDGSVTPVVMGGR